MTSQLAHSDLQLFGSLKKHLADKGFATEADVKQTVTSCLQNLTPLSSTPGHKPWRHDRSDTEMSVSSGVCNLLPRATYTSKSEYGSRRQSVHYTILKLLCISVKMYSK
jgi:hypothetical protein